MTQKTLGELKLGQWIAIGHSPKKDIRGKRKWKSRYFRNYVSPKFHIECFAEVREINRIFGHTWIVRYFCCCGRYFEERLKTSAKFNIIPIEEVNMRKLTK